jgi:hypothetical protein
MFLRDRMLDQNGDQEKIILPVFCGTPGERKPPRREFIQSFL